MADPPPPCHLLNLPREIRDMIYSYVFAGAILEFKSGTRLFPNLPWHYRLRPQHLTSREGGYRRTKQIHCALLRTCHQIHLEAHSVPCKWVPIRVPGKYYNTFLPRYELRALATARDIRLVIEIERAHSPSKAMLTGYPADSFPNLRRIVLEISLLSMGGYGSGVYSGALYGRSLKKGIEAFAGEFAGVVEECAWDVELWVSRVVGPGDHDVKCLNGFVKAEDVEGYMCPKPDEWVRRVL